MNVSYKLESQKHIVLMAASIVLILIFVASFIWFTKFSMNILKQSFNVPLTFERSRQFNLEGFEQVKKLIEKHMSSL